MNKRLLTGLGLFALICLLTFNFTYIYRNDTMLNDTMVSNGNIQHKYIVVIGSPVSYSSRRGLIRSSYFGIQDNLQPISKGPQQIDYVFCIYGEPTKSNTPEKRAFETEKMEYNDIYQLGKSIEFNEANVVDWVRIIMSNDVNDANI